MNKYHKYVNYFKNGTLIHKINQIIGLKILTFFTKNKNASIYIMQCKNYRKLKNKFKYVINKKYKNTKQKNSNKVWFCWLQGYESAPDLVKACYNSLKLNMPDKEIIFLSESNISNYISFPEYINKKYVRKKRV